MNGEAFADKRRIPGSWDNGPGKRRTERRRARAAYRRMVKSGGKPIGFKCWLRGGGSWC